MKTFTRIFNLLGIFGTALVAFRSLPVVYAVGAPEALVVLSGLILLAIAQVKSIRTGEWS
ncbi:hypothetical protein ACFFP0_24720 [Rhizobium puerariae]|uniref:Uncharacterized protein n=1 Tax=Rhizobium puerariae TaxID=1585791 RepID=A0ABV6AN63_9HYPH